MTNKLTRKESLGLLAGTVAACLAGPALRNMSGRGALDAAEDPRFVREALFWKKLPGGDAQCVLCPNGCRLAPGERGICRVRKNFGGTLKTLVYGRIAALHVDPVEKKPLYHFLPGAKAYSIATAGCNLTCRFCQNWELSQSNPEDLESVYIAPERLVRDAKGQGAKIIAYTYNEPVVQYEYVLDSARIARAAGLRPVMVSNGYIRPDAGRKVADTLGAYKIDLKAFSEKFYRDVCGGGLAEVKKNLEAVVKTGVWMEIVVLVIPTLNDSPGEIRNMTSWIARSLSPDIPVHFTRFRAMYKIQNLPPTPVSTLVRCRDIARSQGVRYAYIGNVPGHPYENTYCARCGKAVVIRSGSFHVQSGLKNGRCPHCATAVPGVWS